MTTISSSLRTVVVALLWTGILAAQPTLQQVWARHDQLALQLTENPAPFDPGWAHVFTGRRGRTVRGWDVGAPTAPVVLHWGGGPGLELRPDHYLSGHSVGVALRHVSVDQPGTGGSAWIPGWKPEDTVDDAAEFLRLRGITEPVLLEGWSWGSTMALLFAQRHPRLVRGIVIGGMWTNTRKEVRAYLDADGARAWMPGWTEQFSVFTNGHGSACDLHRAIREGAGGGTLAEAYDAAESEQAGSGQIPRQPLPGPIPRVSSPTPVDMETESDETIRFAYIESEMMCRGQRGIWRLRLQFPRRLASVPLVVIQGRYDQVCLPETAQRVVRAWPGSRKLLVPMNGGHGSFRSPRREDLERAGVSLPAEQQWALEKAAMLSYGNGGLLKRAALECLAGAGQQ